MTLKDNIRSWLGPLIMGSKYKFQFDADGMTVRKRLLTALEDPRFVETWNETVAFNAPYWPNGDVPDIRWRAHTAIWAARHALTLEGDFVEFGVNTGILATMILKNTKLETSGKKFYLFDTFEGIPISQALDSETARANSANSRFYNHDGIAVAKQAFSGFESATFVQGLLPGSIDDTPLEKVAYVSVDLNITEPEIASIEKIWDRISKGGAIVLDDYGHRGYEDQHMAWNAFAARKERMILNLPTGQGLLLR